MVVRSPPAEQTLVHTQERQPSCRRGTLSRRGTIRRGTLSGEAHSQERHTQERHRRGTIRKGNLVAGVQTAMLMLLQPKSNC